MVTTSGAAAPAHTAPAASGTESPRGTRERLIAVVRSVEAYVAGRDCIPASPPAAVPPPTPAASPARARTVFGPVPGPPPADVPQRPRPLDKPFTVAHYQNLARQVAYERQVSDLGPSARPPFDTCLAPGDARRG